MGFERFGYCKSLETLVLGKNIERIGTNSFGGADSLHTIKSYNVIPPILEFEFTEDNYNSATLFVEKEALDLYKVADGWSKFINIKILDVSSVDDNNIDEKNELYLRYDLSGRLITKPTKGINILVLKNGNVKKVLVP